MFILIFLLLEIKSVIIFVNETIHYPLTDFFGYLENPTYQIVDPQNSYLSIIPQFNPKGDTQTHSQNADVISSAKGEFFNGYWTNQFFFLELNNGTYYIHYSENPQFENEATPKFDHQLLVTDSENYVCYDVELFNGTYFIVDCVVKTEEQIFQNKLLIISKDNVIEAQTVSSLLEYQSIQKRKLQLSSNSDQYRFFLFQAFMQGDVESIIQIYEIDNKTNIFFSEAQSISTDWLKKKLNLSDSYSFNLLDLKVINDQIGLLDKQFFCILYYNGSPRMEYFLEFTEEVIAFDIFEDFNYLGLSNRLHVILKKNSFDLYQNKTKLILTYLLKTPASDYAQIKISQKYIIIEDNGKLFQYKINETVLLWQETLPGFHKYLINPQYPGFIQIGNNYTKRYSISEGYLHIQSSSSSLDPTVYTIKAISSQKSMDQQFQLQILKENDGMMYLNGKSKSIIKDAIYSTKQQQYVTPFVSSPKIEIGVDPLDNPHDIEFVIKNDMFIEEWPATDTIHFQDMLLYNDNLIYVFFQLKDKLIQLWKCNQTLDSLIESCKKVKLVSDQEIKFTVFINQTNVQWWIKKTSYRFSYVEDTYMWLYTIEEGFWGWKKISYYMPVTEVTRLRKNLVYLFAQNKTLHIRNDDPEYIIIIDENYVKKLGITFDWSPKKLFGNYKQQNHLLFIQNEDNLMVAIFQDTFHIVKSFPITGDIEITIHKDTFFLSRILSGKSILEQYSIKDIHNIYLMRSIQLFNYEFYSPLTIAQSRDSGFLFILAKSQEVLVFKPNQENSNDDLFRVFDVQFQDFVIMSACGYKKTHFYFNNGTDSTFFAILNQSQMIVKSKMPKVSIQGEDYFSNFTQYMFFRNNKQKYDFGVKIENLNIQQNFTLHNQQKLSVPRDQSFYRVPLNNLYSGEVLSLTCDGCDNKIQLITPLQIQSQKKPSNHIWDFQKYSSSYDVILGFYGLKFIDHDQNLKQVLQLWDYCLYMQVQQNSKFIILLSVYFYSDEYEYPDYSFKLITCDILLNCSIQNIVSDEINLAKKMILLTNNLVLVLDLGKILVYYIDGQTITFTQLIQDKTAFTNFIVQEQDEGGKNYNILTIIDESKNLHILFAEFAENKLKIISNSSISIQNLMIESGYFASNTMVYVQLFAIQSAKEGQLNYIVVSDHEASASLQIILNNNKEIESATVLQVFIPYSDWIISEGLAAQFDEWLLLPYQNENNYLLALYHINNSQTVQSIIYAHLIPRNWVPDSYYKWFIWYGPVIYSFNKTSFNLFTSGGEDEESAITIFEIRNYPELLFNQTNDLQHTQTIILTANNIKNTQSINLTIEKSGPSPDPTPDPIPIHDTSSDIYIWIIALIAIGSITIIGIIIVIYMKYKQIGWFKVHINGYQENVEI